MENGSILKLFPNVNGGELKSVTLSLSQDVHEIADRNAGALRISKRRWLELLIENTVNEHGGNHARSENHTQGDVSTKRLGQNPINSKSARTIATGFNSLRDHEGGE